MADDFRPGEDDRIVAPEQTEPERYGRRGRRIMTGLVAVAAVLGFGVVLVYAYNKGRQDGTNGVPPIIQAQEGPSKIRPENPGGMTVPNQDKEVFNRLETEKQAGKVERLLPAPEKPMTPPAPPVIASEELTKMETAAGVKTPEPPPAPAAVQAPMPAPPATPEVAPKTVEQLAATPPKAPPASPKAKPAAKTEKAASEPKPAAKKTTVANRTPSGSYRVQMSSLRSQSAVQKSWVSVRKRHADLLGRLSLSIESVTLSGGRGTYYRMQAGPLASRAQASALCASLKKRKQSCIVVKR